MSEPNDKSQSPWLIRSGGRILGPWTFQEVVSRLSEREIFLLDECVFPLGRWRALRDEPSFAAAIRDIRKDGRIEDQVTETAHNLTMTGTLTGDVEMTAPANKPERPKVPPPSGPPKGAGQVASANGQGGVKSYGYSEDRNMKSKMVRPSLLMWSFVGLIVLALSGGAVFLKQREHRVPGVDVPETFEAVFAAALSARRLGDYQKAITYFKRAHQMKPLDVQVQLHLAPLMVRIERQTLAAKRMMNELLAITYQEDDGRVIHTTLGLAAIIDKDLDEAIKQFEMSLAKDPEYGPALFNMGLVQYLRGQMSQALEYFRRAEAQVILAAPLMIARVYLEIGRQNPEALAKADETLQGVISSTFNFQQEALFLSVLKSERADDADLDDRVAVMLDTDPALTAQHVHDPLVYDELLRWPSLAHECGRVSEAMNDAVLKKSLLGYCLFRINNKKDAQTYFEGSTSGEVDSLPLALHSYFRREMRDQPNIGAKDILLQKALRNPKYSLPIYLQVRDCLIERNVRCLETQIPKLAQNRRFELAAKAAFAELALLQGRTDEARITVQRGLELSPQYAPFLRIETTTKPVR